MYQRIIQEVIECSLIDFEEAGVSAATLEDLRLVSEGSKNSCSSLCSFLCRFHSFCAGTTPFQNLGQVGHRYYIAGDSVAY